MNNDDRYNLALEEFNNKNYNESINLLNEILQNDESHYFSWNLLGNIFFQLKDLDRAKDFFIAAINKKSDFFDAYYMLGSVLYEAKMYEDALNIWLEAQNYKPDFPLVYANISIVYEHLNKKEEAINFANKALSIDKNCIEALFCLAKIHQKEINIEKTQYYLEKVLRLDSNNTLANFDLSYIYLAKENYKKAFKHYEHRKKMPNRKHEYNYMPFKEYKTEKLKNKKLLIYHEQGFGDNIQFIRFLNDFKSEELSVGIQNPLNKLFSYNFPNIKFLDEIKSDMGFDFMTPLMSIPYINKINKISNKKYLDVNKNDLDKFKNKFIKNDTYNIGLVWKGSTANKQEDIKSIELKQLNTILSKNDCNFYNLQIENYEEIKDYEITNLGKDFKDFYDTALAIKSMDLIIGVDTAVSHLAGALGVKTMLIYNNNTIDFRWIEKNRTSIWYESIEVYTPDEINIIDEKIENLKKENN